MKSKKNLLKRFVALFLCLLLFFEFPLHTMAQGESSTGVVNGDAVRVRTSPGTANKSNLLTHNGQVVRLYHPHPLTISQSNISDENEGKDENGAVYKWFQVSFDYNGNRLSGYIRADLVTVNPVSSTPSQDADFETYLTNFPESYRASLRALHAQHPTWRFEAFHTKLDWATVQKKENVFRKSLTNSTNQSYYSTAEGCYDWSTDTFKPLEAGSWYQAAPELVAYYMDPRNFLNEEVVFQFESLAFVESTQTEENIAKMLKGTFMEGKTATKPDGSKVSYAAAFLDAARAAGVSAFHLISRCIQEVGWKGNGCSLGTYPGYEGYYNFFNIHAYSGAEDGMIYAKSKGWNSDYLAIVDGASFIGNNYIAIGQNTPYFQKYDVVDPNDVGTHQYMTNVAAAYSEGKIQYGKYKDMNFLESSFTFRIPIYENMPQNPCAAPVASGSPNNLLKQLSVEGYSLTPAYDLSSGVTEFSLVINGDVPTINVFALTVSSFASLRGSIGTVPIWTGENRLRIICTSASGVEKYYTIKVTLNGVGSPGEPPKQDDLPGDSVPSGWNHSFSVHGNHISGLTPGMDVNSFLSSLGLYGRASAVLTDENGNACTGGTVRTGLLLNYYDGANTTQLKLVLYGDTNKDSSIDAIDLLMIRRYLLGITPLDGATLEAGDVNQDGAVDAIDLLMVRKTLLGLSSIKQ